MSRERHCEVRDGGAGLVELMVAMLLSLVLIAGALVAHQRSRAALRTAETVARLQDAGRLALDVLEADVRMASHWGLLSRAALVSNRAGPGEPLPATFTAAQGSRIDLCGGAGSRWAIDLDAYLDGTDDGYGLACGAVGGAQAGSDTLVLRRAAESPASTLDPDRIHLQASHRQGALFVPSPGCTSAPDPACLPAGYSPAASRSRALVVRAYYVSSGSTLRPDLPALRRKSFGNVNASAASDAITDEEIVAGIEDLQVRFGVDHDGDGSVDAHASPGHVPAGGTVVAATLWLRIRAEQRDPGHVDTTAWRYADMAAPFVAGDAFRRIVLSRTIQLRNVRS